MNLPNPVSLPLTVTDQLGRRVVIPFPPQRIVSLVPSQTELLFDLGLGERVVGVTKFCIHPAYARQRATIVGGTKNFDFAKIDALKPDLIIGNKEENYQEGIEQLATSYPVWLSGHDSASWVYYGKKRRGRRISCRHSQFLCDTDAFGAEYFSSLFHLAQTVYGCG
jgi:ABC-type Fe3+-hydroxamate transport system substrate-binding protein